MTGEWGSANNLRVSTVKKKKRMYLCNRKRIKKSHLSTFVSAEVFVDVVDGDGNVLEAMAEAMIAFGLHLLKLLIAFLSCACAGFER